MSADAHILMAMEDVRAAVRKRIDHGADHVREHAHQAVEQVVSDLLTAVPTLQQHPGHGAVAALLRGEADDVLRAA